MTTLKMIALVMSLGIDTLMVPISLGFVKTKGKWRVATTFAFVEAFMPLIGLVVGRSAGHLVGSYASFVGGVLLILLAIWLTFFDHDDDDNTKFERDLIGWTLILTALTVSLDELAVGFSVALVGVPVLVTIILIALQAFLFTMIGITFGARLKPLFGEWAEKVAGCVLGVLGIWILAEAVLHLVLQ
ncbi:manganese efflux pump MntP [Alicyclobacillus dauci]|uniref:Manganese efflux pump MntP family protein n=1 Tax=Alicyclobacillus dauci TaxID=1475485 RepID=A0ABY6Z798_9BACL|nr:manganese efflux pump [Alicyclobacillus dauci]WAH38151.1 manganese efflux pump MntP family protein [Alicyclobacillus dauci]